MSFFSRMFIGTDREFAGIEMDAILSEQYEFNSNTTDHTVDWGADISDHIVKQQRIYTMEAVVTDTPMGLLAALEQIGNTVSAAVSFVRENLLGEDADPNDATSRSLAAFSALVQLWDDKQVFDVQTGMGLYENLTIVNIRVMVDESTAGKLHFITTLKQLRRVLVVTTDDEQQDLEEGEVAQSGEPVKKEGLKQKVTKVVDSVKKSVTDFFA